MTKLFNNENKKNKNNLRNSLINELTDRLTPAKILYSDIEELQEIKDKNIAANANNRHMTPKEEIYKRNENNKKNMSGLEEKPKFYSNIWENDKDFNRAMQFLYPAEGGYSNIKGDFGGPTNLGVTQDTYDYYNKRNGLPLKNIKNITKDEATRIYYKDFWKGTGADKIQDKKLSLIYFDTAVNCGPYYAKKYLDKSGGDLNKYLELRKKHYIKLAQKEPESQNQFLDGWFGRINNLKNFIDKNY